MRSKSLASLLLILVACTKTNVTPPQTTTPVTTTTAAPAPVPSGPRVVFPDGYVVGVELAIDDETRAQGLMYRDQLRPATGMLFLFKEDGHYPFWMKNTLIPLDIIWIDASHRVAHVKFDVPPCRTEECPSYAPNVNARYVLEVAGGVAKQHGLKAGDALRFEELDRYIAR
jgi:uncharacterized protein